jgi:5'-3' exonuclease
LARCRVSATCFEADAGRTQYGCRRGADAFCGHLRLFLQDLPNELYAEYKANRSAPPEDLIPQFGLIRQATRAFSLPCIEMEGFEADDLIATYARLACETGGDTTIISSDKDLMQLVGPTVGMYDPMKDKQIGIPEVIEKWGVPPEKMIDLQALVGDSVDNVPGVPGIGPKTAAQLLDTYGDLDTLLARAGESSRRSGGRRSSTMRIRRVFHASSCG